jgi:hypothetical protein
MSGSIAGGGGGFAQDTARDTTIRSTTGKHCLLFFIYSPHFKKKSNEHMQKYIHIIYNNEYIGKLQVILSRNSRFAMWRLIFMPIIAIYLPFLAKHKNMPCLNKYLVIISLVTM